MASLHSDCQHVPDLVVRTHRIRIRNDLDQDSANDETDERIDHRTIPEFRQGKYKLHYVLNWLGQKFFGEEVVDFRNGLDDSRFRFLGFNVYAQVAQSHAEHWTQEYTIN